MNKTCNECNENKDLTNFSKRKKIVIIINVKIVPI